MNNPFLTGIAHIIVGITLMGGIWFIFKNPHILLPIAAVSIIPVVALSVLWSFWYVCEYWDM